MGRSKKFRTGQRISSLPTQSWNRTAAKVDELTLTLTTEEDLRKPKVKSPVHAQIVWCSDTDCEPGNVILIRGCARNLSTDDGAPFAGLLLLATEFDDSDRGQPCAIAMGEIDGGRSWDADLTTRTDADTGELTMPDDTHGIAEGDKLVLIWNGGCRVGVVAGEVVDEAVPIDGGYGDDLPAEDAAIRVTLSAVVGGVILPEAYWAKVDFSSADHRTASPPATGTVLESETGGPLLIVWKETGTGEKWAVVQMAGGVSPFDVAIVDSFDGATWDGTNKTNEIITVYPFAADGSISDARSMEVVVSLGLESPRTITSGKFITGMVQGRKLIQAQCPEWDLPEGWGES